MEFKITPQFRKECSKRELRQEDPVKRAIRLSLRQLKDFASRVDSYSELEYWQNRVYIVVRISGTDQYIELYKHADVLAEVRKLTLNENIYHD